MSSRIKEHSLVIVIWLTCLVVSGISVLSVYMINSYDKEYLAISDEIRTIVDKDEHLTSVRSLVRDTKGDIDKLDRLFLDEDAIPQFVSSLESLSDKYDASASVSSLNLDAAAAGSPLKTLKVKISASGKWPNIISLLAELESSSQASVVDAVALSKRGSVESDADASWGASIDLRILVSSSKQ